MILNLNPDQWELIKDLDSTQKSILLEWLFCGMPEIKNPTTPAIAIKIAYNFITAKKIKKQSNDITPAINISYNENTGLLEGITPELFEYYTKCYPAVNVEQELLKISAWCKANPDKKKSKYNRFVNAWLSRTQDKGGNNGY